jgi:hypothetical protein
VSAIHPSVHGSFNLVPKCLASAWELEPDVIVRPPQLGDQLAPCLHGDGAQAVLELAGRAVVRGNRARVVQLAWELVALRGRTPDSALARFGVELITVRSDGRWLSPSLACWLAPYACRLHHAESFGSADQLAVSVASTVVDLRRETVQLGLGDRLDVYLCRQRARPSEIALLVERLA